MSSRNLVRSAIIEDFGELGQAEGTMTAAVGPQNASAAAGRHRGTVSARLSPDIAMVQTNEREGLHGERDPARFLRSRKDEFSPRTCRTLSR